MDGEVWGSYTITQEIWRWTRWYVYFSKLFWYYTMDSKVLIERILLTLQPKRPAAGWILLLVKQWVLGDDQVQKLIGVFEEVLKNEKNEEAMQWLQKSIQILKNIEALEVKSIQEDQEALDELEAMIAWL